MRNYDASFIYIMLNSISSFCYSMLLTVELVYLSQVVGFNPLQLVLIGTVRQSVSFLFQVPTGVLADMYSRRWAVVLGILLIGVGYLIEGAIPIFVVVFAAQILLSLGVTLADGADSAWIADELGVERAGPVYLRAAQIGSIASLLGIAISAGLVNVQLNLPIVLGGSLFIVLSILLLLVMPERHFAPVLREDRSTFQQMRHLLRIGIQMVRLRPVLIIILSIGIFSGAFSAGFDQLWQYYLLHRFAFPALGGLTSVTWFCIIEACIVATQFCGIEIARRCVDTNSHRAVVVALFVVDALSVVSIIGFAVADQFVLALTAFFIFTMGRGPYQSLQQVWMNQHLDSSVRATVFSLRGQVSAVAQIIGGPLLGIIATAFSTSAALIVSAIVLSPTLLLYVITQRSSKRKAISIEPEPAIK
jgi:DHA3 family tetracycline resistance protein-like MFS transporter